MATRRRESESRALEQNLERAGAYLKQPGKLKPRYVFERQKIDVKSIRESMRLSRQEFAMRFGLSLRTLENWEDNRREPEGPARTLLITIMHHPGAVAAAVQTYQEGRMRPTTEATDTAIAIGSVFHGHVKKIQDFGACVELVPGADGLVHISQPQQTKYYKDVLKVGAPVAVKVLGFDKRGALNLAMLGEEDA